jgi:cyclic 2,3-diphosphoglycerate synthetase
MRAVLLIDGEHHPTVVADAVRALPEAGYHPVAALFLGGSEKAASPPDLPCPVVTGDPGEILPGLIRSHQAQIVLDWSDEPILDAPTRFLLAGLSLAAGVSYRAGGMELDPPPRPRLTDLPAVAVVGTGKRTGKTAVSIELARWLRDRTLRPVVVTMGRGGPPEPLTLLPDEARDPFALFEDLVSRGLHAVSDYVEDAIFAGVPTVGTRRLGAGPAGVTVSDRFAAGVAVASTLSPDLMIYEGSGTALPPAHADFTILVTRGDHDPRMLIDHLGVVRFAVADLVLVVGPDRLEDAPVLRRLGVRRQSIQLVPEATVEVTGRRVMAFTTARGEAATQVKRHLEEAGAERVEVFGCLADRPALGEAVRRIPGDALVLTEVKAAAAEVVVPAARAVGADVGLLHNRPVVTGTDGFDPVGLQVAEALGLS